MKNADPKIDAYIDKAAPFAQPISDENPRAHAQGVPGDH